jgi:hypothetical protein
MTGRSRIVVLAASLLAALVLAVAVPQAHAEYNGKYYFGCTYSWGSACFGPYQHLERLETLDPGAAYTYYRGQHTNNGYKDPIPDGHPRDGCAGVYNAPNQTYPWVCNWERAYEEPHQWGQPMIGTAVEYYNIAMYSYANGPYIG